MSLIVISFDGVKDTEFENMAALPHRYPNIAAFMQHERTRYTGDVYTTFVSNTYPIHSCISTGRHPKEHGIISNILGQTDCGADIWAQEAKHIMAPTIFDAAAKKGLTAGTIAWPVTCGSKAIKWNLPEVHLLPGQKRVHEQLHNGSIFFQIRALMRHRKKMKGLQQPYLDDLFTSVMVDLLREKKPDMAMVHFLAYDGICHEFGFSEELDTARAALDQNLGRVMAVADKDATILIFSDHGHLSVSENIDLSPIFGDTLYEQCGGSAFFARKVEIIEEYPWFGRMLTDEEMDVSGYAGRAAFGIGAARGYSFSKGPAPYRGNHGYPRDYDEYRVFHAIKNAKHSPHHLPFDDIRNVTAMINQELGLGMDL